MSKIFDVNLKVRTLADNETDAFQRAVAELGLQAEAEGQGCSWGFHVPLPSILDSNVEIQEFQGDENELPILNPEDLP